MLLLTTMNAHTLNIIINYQLPPVEITHDSAFKHHPSTFQSWKCSCVTHAVFKQYIKETLCYFRYDTYQQEGWKSSCMNDYNA